MAQRTCPNCRAIAPVLKVLEGRFNCPNCDVRLVSNLNAVGYFFCVVAAVAVVLVLNVVLGSWNISVPGGVYSAIALKAALAILFCYLLTRSSATLRLDDPETSE